MGIIWGGLSDALQLLSEIAFKILKMKIRHENTAEERGFSIIRKKQDQN